MFASITKAFFEFLKSLPLFSTRYNAPEHNFLPQNQKVLHLPGAEDHTLAMVIYITCRYFHNRPYDAKNPYLSPIKVNRELHKGGGRSCMHIELDITGSRIR